MKFSVALIARNEEKTLPRLLESLGEFRARGGEVVLVDTGSTDKTAHVARAHGVIVHEVGDKFRVQISDEEVEAINKQFVVQGDPNVVNKGDSLFDFASARNFAALLCENDMVAMPDCDEVYTKLDLNKINEHVEAGIEQFEYNFVFSHTEEGVPLVEFMHSKFYNRRKLWWQGIIHEVLASAPCVMCDLLEHQDHKHDVKRLKLGQEVIKLEHYQNVETNRTGYLKGLAYDCFKNPMNDRNAHYFGREMFYRGHYRSAIKQLLAHVQMGGWKTEASESWNFVGDAQMARGFEQLAIAAYAHAFDLEPNRREPLMKLAEHYYRKGSPDHVIAYIAAALQVKGGDFYANFAPYYEHLPHELMYWALWQKGELNASKKHFDICFAYQPFNSKYMHDFRFYYNLPKVSFIIPTLGREEGLKRCVDSIKALNYPEDKIEIIVVEDTPRIGVPKRLKEGFEKATGSWIVYASNDTEFTPDSLMAALKTSMDNQKWFMAFNTGEVSPDEGNICEHFMIHRRMIHKIGGEIFDTEFNHVGVDNLLWAKMKKLNQAMKCQRAVVHHYHFSNGAPMDEVYQLAWNEEAVKKDRELLERKLKELNEATLFA